MKYFKETLIDRINWSLVILVALSSWLSASVVVDLVVIPSLANAGMMAEPGFMNAGHALFSVFNHLELLLAALVMTSYAVLRHQGQLTHNAERWGGLIVITLLAIAVGYTYGLTPAMSDLGFEMSAFNSSGEMPSSMMPLHWFYWSLELVKFGFGVMLFAWIEQPRLTTASAE